MALPDVLKFVSAVKDHLHAEWANFKKLSVVNISPVCIYAVGGQKDIPVSCLESVCNAILELEKVLKETFDVTVDKESPIVSHDIMVGGSGQIIIYPNRKYKSESSSTTLAPPQPPVPPGRRQKKQQTPEDAFMGGVEQVVNYSLDHLKRLSESCLLSGNIKVLYLLLSSALLLRSRIITYKEVLKTPVTKGLTTTINRCNDKIELMTQHLLNYHSDIIRSAILHDVNSHDWNSEKPYEENEQISLCIRMWSFHMQGLRNDLWRYTSPKIAENIFNTIFADNLGLLVTRYTQIEPSDMRLKHMQADIIAIFLITASFLPSLAASPRFFFEGKIHESLVFSIHRRMDLLVRIAALRCCPVETLANVYSHGIHASKRISQNAKDSTRIVECPDWLTFFNASLFPANTKRLATIPDSVAVYLTLLNAALRPFPNHGLIIRGLIIRDFLGSKIILRGLQDLPGHVEKSKPCGGALCLSHICSTHLIPHTVYSAIVGLLVKCFQSSQILNHVMQSGVKESGNWDVLDRMQVWNNQRPPWHHALVQLAGQHVAIVVAEVLESVPVYPPAQPAHPSQVSVRLEHHLSAWTQQLINGVENMADTIPPCLIQIAQSINSSLPPTIKPVGGHVISQIIISAIYSIVNSRESLNQLSPNGVVSDGQWDMMVAVGERLCSLHTGNYDKALEQMTNALLKQLTLVEKDDEDKLDDYVNEEVIETVCQQFADVALSSLQGQHSFGMIWEYLKRNMEWIRHSLNVPPLLKVPSNVPVSNFTPKMSFTPTPDIYNPLYFYNRIVYTNLNQRYLLNFEANWEEILEGDLWLPTEVIKDLILKRPEFRPEAILSPSQAAAVNILGPFLKKKTVCKDNAEDA